MHESHAATSVLLVLIPCLPAQAPTSGQDAKITPEVRAINAAEGGELEKLLHAFMEEKVASGAVYQGQYAALRHADEAAQTVLTGWVSEAPTGIDERRAPLFRTACIRAKRDIHDTKAPEALVELLRSVTNDEFESKNVREEAMYALAQFGDRARIERELANLEKAIASETPLHRAQGYNGIAKIRHNLREYAAAAKALAELIKLNDDGKVPIRPSAVAHLLYNRSCALALSDQIDQAFATFERALTQSRAHGNPLTDRLLTTDQEIRALRTDPRFGTILKQHRAAIEAAEAAARKKDADPAKKGQ